MSCWISWAISPLQRHMLDGIIQWPHLSASRCIMFSGWLVFAVLISGVSVLSVTFCTFTLFDKDSSPPSLEIYLAPYLSWWQHNVEHIIVNAWVNLNLIWHGLFTIFFYKLFFLCNQCVWINVVIQLWWTNNANENWKTIQKYIFLLSNRSFQMLLFFCFVILTGILITAIAVIKVQPKIQWWQKKTGYSQKHD